MLNIKELVPYRGLEKVFPHIVARIAGVSMLAIMGISALGMLVSKSVQGDAILHLACCLSAFCAVGCILVKSPDGRKSVMSL